MEVDTTSVRLGVLFALGGAVNLIGAKVLNGPMIDQSEIWEALANPIYQANPMYAMDRFA